MGCDIHMYLEYGRDEFFCSFGARVNPGRDYGMFSLLAGVREYDNAKPLFAPRGIPEKLGFRANDDFYLFINDEFAEHEGYVTLQKALEWEKYGSKIVKDLSGKPFKLEHPDWHTPSWLTGSELEGVFSAYQERFGEVEAPYKAVLAALRCLSEGSPKARIVFWFDN